jgi:hypothetical protein
MPGNNMLHLAFLVLTFAQTDTLGLGDRTQ